MSAIADRAVQKMPALTRVHVLEEGEHDPAFWPYFARLATQPEPGMAIDEDMKRAAINAFDPAKYKDSGARWPVLQAKMMRLKEQIQTPSGVGDIPGIITSYDQLESPTPAAAPVPASSSGPSIWTTIAGAVAAIAPAAANIYSSSVLSNAQKSVAQIQTTAAQNIALAQAQQQAQAGSTSTALYIILGLLGLGGLLFLFTTLSRGRR